MSYEENGQRPDKDGGGHHDDLKSESHADEVHERSSWHEPKQYEYDFTDRNNEQTFYRNDAQKKEAEGEEDFSPVPAPAPPKRHDKHFPEPMAAYSSQNVAARKKQEQEAADRRRSIGGRGSGRDRSSSNSRRDSEDERARKQQQWDKMDRSGVTSPEGLPSPQKSLRVSESPHSPEINRRNTVNAGRTPGPAPFKTQSSPVPQGRTMSPKTRGSSLSPDTRGKNAQSNSNSPTGARRRLSTGGSFKARKDTSVPRGGKATLIPMNRGRVCHSKTKVKIKRTRPTKLSPVRIRMTKMRARENRRLSKKTEMISSQARWLNAPTPQTREKLL